MNHRLRALLFLLLIVLLPTTCSAATLLGLFRDLGDLLLYALIFLPGFLGYDSTCSWILENIFPLASIFLLPILAFIAIAAVSLVMLFSLRRR